MDARESSLGLVRWIGLTQRKGADEWARERNLTIEQAFCLGWLIENPGAIQREVAEVTHTSAASVSSLLQGLERRELVQRRTEPGSERTKRVYATAQAADLVAGFEQAMAATDEQILSPLTEQERQTLHELLTKIVKQLPPLTRA